MVLIKGLKHSKLKNDISFLYASNTDLSNTDSIKLQIERQVSLLHLKLANHEAQQLEMHALAQKLTQRFRELINRKKEIEQRILQWKSKLSLDHPLYSVNNEIELQAFIVEKLKQLDYVEQTWTKISTYISLYLKNKGKAIQFF
jgi:uncharacterized protein (DUF3084 family)